MKKNKIALFTLAFSLVLFVGFACDSVTGDEECSSEEICEGKSVSACCTEDGCYYTYNGTTYSASEVDQLAIDLGCTNATSGPEIDAIKERLMVLRETANMQTFQMER